MLVPIGSWCRTAYQVRQFVQAAGNRRQAYPFDWTITPFAALQTVLDPDFQPAKKIELDNLVRSHLGSALDKKTGLIYHHDLPMSELNALINAEGVNDNGLILALKRHRQLRLISGRHRYAFKNLYRLKHYREKIGFVRWVRFGHPDRQIPQAFDGEDLETVCDILRKFLGHENFALLHVRSERVSNFDKASQDPITSYETSQLGTRASIRERKGFNGDGTNSYQGDAVPWQTILSRFVAEQNLQPISKSYNVFERYYQSWSRRYRGY